MTASFEILFVAAENDALSGGKVGGVGDVVRDVPPALAALPEFAGSVSVVVPSYGFLHREPLRSLGTIEFSFAGVAETAELFEVRGKRPTERVRQLVLHHEKFEFLDPQTNKHRIYCDDPPDAPFATDSTRFALFCAAVAEGLIQGRFGAINRLHLHDWHCGTLLVLREFNPRYALLKTIRTAFTIHNTALQGVRPVRGEVSSLEEWFPDLDYRFPVVADPDYIDCFNPMAVGIRLADRVHVVSPSYADEICEPSRPGRNHPQCVFFGGEGLEGDLQQARAQGRLVGILNGCEYSSASPAPVPSDVGWQTLLSTLITELEKWTAASPSPRHHIALRRLRSWQQQARPNVVMTSVTRVADQKVRLMRYPEGPSPIERLLARSADDAVYIMAGTGDGQYESFFAELAELYENFVFVNGFSIKGADALYVHGDLFLMPSAFEPCGISQMLAMRAGQPCVVHAIGGLKDTVQHMQTGICFSGSTPEELGLNFVDQTLRAIRAQCNKPADFAQIRAGARAQRFLWEDSVRQYVERLYR